MDEKSGSSHLESGTPEMVKALPDGIRRDAGLVLDTEGLDGQLSLKVAADGHV